MLRVGILGTGRMAGTMTRAMMGRTDMAVVAVGSGTRARARDFAATFGIATAHDSQEALLADDQIDLVYIANASRHHAAASVAALQAGRAVLCEKPFALTRAEARAVQQAAQAAGRFFMEGFWTLCLPSWQALVQIARNQTLGQAQHLQFSFGYPIDPGDPAGVTAPQDGGLVFNRAGYGAALACAALGPMTDIAVTGGDPLSLTLTHGQAQSQIAVSSTSLLGNAATLGCTRGAAGLAAPVIGSETLWQNATGPVRMPDASAPGLKQRLQTKPALRRIRALKGGPSTRWLGYGESRYGPMLAHVAARIAAGHTTSDIVTPELSWQCCLALATAQQKVTA